MEHGQEYAARHLLGRFIPRKAVSGSRRLAASAVGTAASRFAVTSSPGEQVQAVRGQYLEAAAELRQLQAAQREATPAGVRGERQRAAAVSGNTERHHAEGHPRRQRGLQTPTGCER